jgi:hypothetical protein
MRITEQRLRKIIREEIINEDIWNSIKNSAHSIIDALDGPSQREIDIERFKKMHPEELLQAFIFGYLQRVEGVGPGKPPSPDMSKAIEDNFGMTIIPPSNPRDYNTITSIGLTLAEMNATVVTDKYKWDAAVERFARSGAAAHFASNADPIATQSKHTLRIIRKPTR